MGIEYELVQMDLGHTIVHRIKVKDKKRNQVHLFKSLIDTPIDEPLCEIIDKFGIPVIRLRGRNYKIRYVAKATITKSLSIDRQRLENAEKKIIWIHPRESMKKQEYNVQVGRQTQFAFVLGGRALILYSLADTIQILSILQNDKEKGRLIRKLIIKLEELQKKIKKQQKEEIKNLQHILEQLDDVCYDWIKEHGKDIYEGYKMLWEHQLWQMIIDIYRRIRDILGLPNPPKNHTGLHHPDRPYRKIYPHIATRSRLVDSRYDHDDKRQKKFIV